MSAGHHETSPAGIIHKMIEEHVSFRFFRAVVTGTSGDKVFIQRNGQGGADQSAYPRLASYSSPAAGDEVLCILLESAPVVMGKILRS